MAASHGQPAAVGAGRGDVTPVGIQLKMGLLAGTGRVSCLRGFLVLSVGGFLERSEHAVTRGPLQFSSIVSGEGVVGLLGATTTAGWGCGSLGPGCRELRQVSASQGLLFPLRRVLGLPRICSPAPPPLSRLPLPLGSLHPHPSQVASPSTPFWGGRGSWRMAKGVSVCPPPP